MNESVRITLIESKKVIYEKVYDETICMKGGLTSVVKDTIDLSFVTKSTRYDLVVSVGEYSNSYPVWVYKEQGIQAPSNVIVAKTYDQAIAALEEGKNVFLEPKPTKENFPVSIKAQFTTDFWSVGIFPLQEGFMSFSSQLIIKYVSQKNNELCEVIKYCYELIDNIGMRKLSILRKLH